MAVLVLRYQSRMESGTSLPLPVSCCLASKSEALNIINCSGFLEPGSYAILPLAFNHWKAANSLPGGSAMARGDGRPHCVSLHSSKQVQYQEEAITQPGFLAESLFLLSSRATYRHNVSLLANLCIATYSSVRSVVVIH